VDLSLKLPAVIGRYVLEGEVASGGMATVYHGRMSGASGYARTIAIKRMHPHCARDPDFVAMFLDEANLAARIRHPNVVPVLDIVTEGESLIMAMEYVAGDTVDRLLRSARESGMRPPHRIVTAIICGALEGLHAAHEALGDDQQPLNIVHRDVSPQNIIVGFDGVPRVLDFGVAKAAVRLQTTRAGQLKGRLRYMAPEQIRSRPVDRRADVYAASVVLWEMLAGRPLFDADNEGAMMIMVLEGTIPSLRDVDPTLPPSLEWVILKGLRPDPADRFQTAQEMATALERAVGIATPREVADWVRKVVPATSAQRAAKIAGLDLDSFGPEPLADDPRKAPGVPAPPKKEPEKSKNKRLLITAFGVTALLCVIGFWFALHEVPWLGPALIDTSRAVFGNKITAWIERVAHTADAGWSDLWNSDERPEAYWNLPSASAFASASQAPVLRFRPADLQPMNSAPFSREDGSWMPTHASEDDASPLSYRLTLHPDVDRQRSLTRVVAFDLRRTRLELALGKRPNADTSIKSTGLVDPDDIDALMAVLRASKSDLKRPGLGIAGRELVSPAPGACTLAMMADGQLRIDLWSEIATTKGSRRWFRQEPLCLVRSGSEATGLGEFLGERLMAVGVSADAKILYVAVGEVVSPSTMARVIRYSGARHAALIGGYANTANVYFHARFDADAKELLPVSSEEKYEGNLGLTTPSDTDFLYVRKTEL
jgi:serine/threonine protein kinase